MEIFEKVIGTEEEVIKAEAGDLAARVYNHSYEIRNKYSYTEVYEITLHLVREVLNYNDNFGFDEGSIKSNEN